MVSRIGGSKKFFTRDLITGKQKRKETIRDLDYDEFRSYTSKYGRHGTLKRSTKKPIKEFLSEYYKK